MTWQTVKIIAIVSMTLDHAAATFLTSPFLVDRLGISMAASGWIYTIFRALGRTAFPLYAFGMAQGCAYTKNRRKFLLRLLFFAVLAEVPFQLALCDGRIIPLPLPIKNVLFTLLIGSLCCFIWDFCRGKKRIGAAILPIGALILLAEICHTDYGGLGVVFVFVLYVLPEKSWKLAALAALVTWLYGLSPLLRGYTSMRDPASLVRWLLPWLCALSAVGILELYHGREGRRSKLSQYFFYAYYPLHLLLFYGLTQWIGPITIQ